MLGLDLCAERAPHPLGSYLEGKAKMNTPIIPQPVKEAYPPFVALVVGVLQELGAVITVTAPEPQRTQEHEE